MGGRASKTSNGWIDSRSYLPVGRSSCCACSGIGKPWWSSVGGSCKIEGIHILWESVVRRQLLVENVLWYVHGLVQ